MAVRKSSSRGKQISLRHLWLASLGAAVVVRREARDVVAEALRLRGRASANATVDQAAAIVRGGAHGLRVQLNPAIERVSVRVGQVLGPALGPFAGASKKGPTSRKPQARRASTRQAARKGTPRPSSARKQAERRVASKGR